MPDSEEKLLSSQGDTIEDSGVDQQNKKLVICLHGEAWATVNVRVEMLTGSLHCYV